MKYVCVHRSACVRVTHVLRHLSDALTRSHSCCCCCCLCHAHWLAPFYDGNKKWASSRKWEIFYARDAATRGPGNKERGKWELGNSASALCLPFAPFCAHFFFNYSLPLSHAPTEGEQQRLWYVARVTWELRDAALEMRWRFFFVAIARQSF